MRAPRRAGFTLIELLLVMAIILVVAGMIVGLSAADKRQVAVQAAAEELAATLRTARSFAIDQGVVCGVAFNIQNAPGTTGMVLNNWSGGHWYRIVGIDPVSRDTGTGPEAVYAYPIPRFELVSVGGRGAVADFLAAVGESWMGDRHVLPPRKVRFLALTDQDCGTGGWASGGRIPATYPRPWYGWYDESAKTLYPWGGYDGAKPDAQRAKDFSSPARYCSGFYYEGDDGIVAGCRNPVDRLTTNVAAAGQVAVRFLAKDQPRPLVNADWLDHVICFYPDGTAGESAMYARRHSFSYRQADGNAYRQGGTGRGDLGVYTSLVDGEANVVQSFVRHTGSYAVTLAADADADSDSFPSRHAAFKSMWPIIRVMVSTLGDIRVQQVSPGAPAGLTFDTASIPNWQPASPYTSIKNYYRGFIATNADGTLRTDAAGRRYMPVDAFLTPDILASRHWWGLW